MDWRRYGAGCPDTPTDEDRAGQGWGGGGHPGTHVRHLGAHPRGHQTTEQSQLCFVLCDLRQATPFSAPRFSSLSSEGHSDTHTGLSQGLNMFPLPRSYS